MSQDFVRRLPDSGYVYRHKSGLGEKIHLDFPLIFLMLCISLYGLLILFSAVEQQPGPVLAQSIKLGIATVVMVLMAQISPIFYLRLAPALFVIGVILLGLTYLFGYEVNGSKRWLRIPGVLSFQPSELMKLVVPMILA